MKILAPALVWSKQVTSSVDWSIQIQWRNDPVYIATTMGSVLPVPDRQSSSTTTIAAILILAWLSALAGLRPLMLPDEGRYVGVAWEMVRGGDWSTPTLNGLPFFHKPPLFYWITAASLRWFGMNGWAARAAPLLGAWIGAFSLYLFVRRWVAESTARCATIALLAQPLFFGGAQFANLDMLVAGLISATIVLLADATLAAERNELNRSALWGAYLTAALAVLAKGLIGFLLPAIVIFVWLLATRRIKQLRNLLSLPGTIGFALLALPWFIVMQQRYSEFFDYFIVEQHFRRYTGGGFNNALPIWFYPAVLFGTSLPLLPWLISSAAHLAKQIRTIGRPTASESATARTNRRPVESINLLMWCWLGSIVAFFSLPQSKLVGYVLPAIAPLAYLVAAGITDSDDPKPNRRWWAAIASCALIGVGLVVWLTVFPQHSTRALGDYLRQHRHAGEPVIMIGNYYYDIPFYARLGEPVAVIENWGDRARTGRDNWRKELLDAGRFSPAQASSVLRDATALPELLCAHRTSWLIGSTPPNDEFLQSSGFRPLAKEGDAALWRVEANQLRNCPAQPPR
jgi:4-amino-4-deoxy-L-arabinose transferase-like glycosyltransferase